MRGPATDERAGVLLALAAVCAVAGPFLLGDGVDVPDDALYYTVAAWEWLRSAAEAGVSPWYVPGKLGGVSLFNDVVPQGPFYPTILLGRVLPVVPALGIAAALHAVGTLFTVRWFARTVGASAPASLLAGAAVVVGPLGSAAFVDCQVDAWPTFLWLPVVLGALERQGDGDRRWIAVGAAALALLLLGSHLRLSVAACATIGLWCLVRGRGLPRALLTCGLGLLAGSPGFVPMALEAGIAAGESSGLPDLRLAVDLGLGPHALGGWLAPSIYVVDRDVALGSALSAGLLALAPGGDQRLRRLLLFTGILVVAGTRFPLVPWLLAPLTLLTHPINLVYPVLATIPAAALAAQGLDRLLAMHPAERRAWLLGPAGWVLATGLGFAALRVTGLLGGVIGPAARAHQVGSLLQALLGLGLGWWLLQRWRQPRWLPLLALALLDLSLFAVRAHLAVPAQPLRGARSTANVDLLGEGFLDVEDLAASHDSAIAAADAEEANPLLSREADRPRAARGVRRSVESDVALPEQDGPAQQAELYGRRWPPHLAMAIGKRGLAGRSKLPPQRQLAALQPLADAVHEIGAVEYVMQELFGRSDGLGARTLALHGIPTATWGSLLFRVSGGAPPCWSPERIEVQPDEGQRIRTLFGRDHDRTVALVESPVTIGGAARVDCEGERIGVNAPGEALVVLRQRYHPGWQVRDESRELLDTLPVDQVHLGVLVPAGEHELTARFVPPGLRPSLAAMAFGWLAILGLLILRRGSPTRCAATGPLPTATPTLFAAPVLCAALGLLLPAAAQAAVVPGELLERSPDSSYEVWVATSLDLSDPAQPVARDPITADTFDVPLPDSGPAWVFLRQQIARPGAPPLVHFRPLDLAPLDCAAPPAQIRLRGLPGPLARLRAEERPVPGWWGPPLSLALLIGLLGGGLLGLLRWRLAAQRGARTLLSMLREGRPPDAPASPGAPLARHPGPPPVSPGERNTLLALLGLAAAVRVPGLAGPPLDLLEWTYGPGSARVGDQDSSWLVEVLLHPSSVEVTHPPLYHWLLGLLEGPEWLLRAPALLASVATVAALWALFRRAGPSAGLAAAAVVAVSAPAVHFGHDATPYALSGLIAVLAPLLVLRALRRGRRRDHAAWLGLLVVGVLTHYSVGIFGLALVAALGALVVLRARRREWLEAGARALEAGLLLAPLPVLWSAVHFAWFAPVTLDTRLFADVYPLDPGLLTFLSSFLAVSFAAPPGAGIIGGLGLLLATAGLVALRRRDDVAALLVLAILAAWAGQVLFFHANLVRYLDGRIFWGFRWAAWFSPMGLGLAATATARLASRGRPGLSLAGALAAGWAAVAVPFSAAGAGTNRPDYRGAAAIIGDELHERDAVATAPLWGQRGPLRHYLTRGRDARFDEEQAAWRVDGRLVFLEAIDEDLPLQSSAGSGWWDRLWLLVVDERTFDRPKFDPAVARRAVAWADANLTPDGRWSVPGITIHRYRTTRPPPPRLSVTAPELDPHSLRWTQPNAETCLAEEEGQAPRWAIPVRVPVGMDREVSATVRGGSLERETRDPAWRAVLMGGPCSGPAPILELGLSGPR